MCLGGLCRGVAPVSGHQQRPSDTCMAPGSPSERRTGVPDFNHDNTVVTIASGRAIRVSERGCVIVQCQCQRGGQVSSPSACVCQGWEPFAPARLGGRCHRPSACVCQGWELFAPARLGAGVIAQCLCHRRKKCPEPTHHTSPTTHHPPPTTHQPPAIPIRPAPTFHLRKTSIPRAAWHCRISPTRSMALPDQPHAQYGTAGSVPRAAWHCRISLTRSMALPDQIYFRNSDSGILTRDDSCLKDM